VDVDKVGNLIQLTDANGNPTKYTYDAVNRPLFEIPPIARCVASITIRWESD
jgi:hypothetical protein